MIRLLRKRSNTLVEGYLPLVNHLSRGFGEYPILKKADMVRTGERIEKAKPGFLWAPVHNTLETRWIGTLLQTPILWQKLLIYFIDYFCRPNQTTPTTRKQEDILKDCINFQKKTVTFQMPINKLLGKVKITLLLEHPP